MATVLVGTRSAHAVVGGTPANRADYPYFVTMEGAAGVCDGSLIAPGWMLTAAHCVVNDYPDSHYLHVTAYDGTRSAVTGVFVHPLYDPRSADPTHDVALVRLPDSAFPGNPVVQLGAPWDPGAYAEGTTATIMGDGYTNPDNAPPYGFFTAQVPLRGDGYMRGLGFHWDDQLNLGAGGPGATTCHGDSGSPLVVSRNGRPVQVGVTDFGDQNCTRAAGFAEMNGPQLAWVASMVPSVAVGWGDCALDGGATVGQGAGAYATSVQSGQSDGPYSWSIGCVPQSPGFLAVYRGGRDGLLWESDSRGHARLAANGLGVAAGTTPAVAALSGGGRLIAFHANGSDDLWTVTPDNAGHDTGLTMAAGSSPAVTATPDGGYEIAYAGPDNYLRELGPDGVPRFAANVLGVSPGTSPAIAAGPRGGFEIAFHAWGLDTLWTVTPDNVGHDSHAAIAAGTSPAVAALADGTYEVVWTGALPQKLGADGVVRYVGTGLTVASGTGPAIAALPSGGYLITVHSGDTLWSVTASDEQNNLGVYLASGTSPAMAALPAGGYAVSWAAAVDGHVWVRGPGGPYDTGQPASGSPGLTSGRVGPVAGLSGRCMDVSNANPASGTQVQLWACNGTNAQIWTMAPDSTIRALGKCLDVRDGSTADHAAVQIWDCNGTGAQVWRPTDANQLVNPQSGKCLDVTGANNGNGTPLQIYPCNGTGAQAWYPPPESSWTILAPPPPPPVPVPDLEGASLTTATSAIQSAGLVRGPVGYRVDDLCEAVNRVLDQSPAPGTPVPPGSAVSVTIGTRPSHPCP